MAFKNIRYLSFHPYYETWILNNQHTNSQAALCTAQKSNDDVRKDAAYAKIILWSLFQKRVSEWFFFWFADLNSGNTM